MELKLSSKFLAAAPPAKPVTTPKVNPPAWVVVEAPAKKGIDYWYEKSKGAVQEAAHGLPKGMLKLLMEKESMGNPLAKSRAGASGLYQIMPKSISGFSGNPFNPEEAAKFAAETLKKHYDHFNDYHLALAAYNWGRVNLKRHGVENMPPETRKFVKFFKDRGVKKNAAETPPPEPPSAEVETDNPPIEHYGEIIKLVAKKLPVYRTKFKKSLGYKEVGEDLVKELGLNEDLAAMVVPEIQLWCNSASFAPQFKLSLKTVLQSAEAKMARVMKASLLRKL